MIYTAGGCGTITDASGATRVHTGDIVLWPPGAAQDYRTTAGCDHWSIMWAHFRPWPHWNELLDWPRRPGSFMWLHIADSALRRRVCASLRSMDASSQSHLHRGKFFAMNGLEKALLLCAAANPLSREHRLDSRITASLEYITANLAARLTLTGVARHCGMSLSRFCHLFAQQIGATPARWIEQQRLRRVRTLLEVSTCTVGEIAAMTGFESPFYLSRRFKRHLGVSPKFFRSGLAGDAGVAHQRL